MSTKVVDRFLIAQHEAGHAVMRVLLGLPATETKVADDGGFSAGTARMIDPETAVLIALAGFAAENGCWPGLLDHAGCHADDFDQARAILTAAVFLRVEIRDGQIVTGEDGQIAPRSVDDAVQHYYERACEMLLPHEDLIEHLAGRLDANGVVSARSLAATWREHQKRNRPPTND